MNTVVKTDRQLAEEKHFVIASPEDQGNPERMRDLRQEAERSGRMLVNSPKPSFYGQQIAEGVARLAASDMPTITRGDGRAFLKNLDKIARGDVAVKGE